MVMMLFPAFWKRADPDYYITRGIINQWGNDANEAAPLKSASP